MKKKLLAICFIFLSVSVTFASYVTNNLVLYLDASDPGQSPEVNW